MKSAELTFLLWCVASAQLAASRTQAQEMAAALAASKARCEAEANHHSAVLTRLAEAAKSLAASGLRSEALAEELHASLCCAEERLAEQSAACAAAEDAAAAANARAEAFSARTEAAERERDALKFPGAAQGLPSLAALIVEGRERFPVDPASPTKVRTPVREERRLSRAANPVGGDRDAGGGGDAGGGRDPSDGGEAEGGRAADGTRVADAGQDSAPAEIEGNEAEPAPRHRSRGKMLSIA